MSAGSILAEIGTERGHDRVPVSFHWAVYRKERAKNLFRSYRYILVMNGERPPLIAPLELK